MKRLSGETARVSLRPHPRRSGGSVPGHLHRAADTFHNQAVAVEARLVNSIASVTWCGMPSGPGHIYLADDLRSSWSSDPEIITWPSILTPGASSV